VRLKRVTLMTNAGCIQYFPRHIDGVASRGGDSLAAAASRSVVST
jgi:hypothetical protein